MWQNGEAIQEAAATRARALGEFFDAIWSVKIGEERSTSHGSAGRLIRSCSTRASLDYAWRLLPFRSNKRRFAVLRATERSPRRCVELERERERADS